MVDLHWDGFRSECVLVTQLALCEARARLKPCSRKTQSRALRRWAELGSGWKQKLFNSQNLLAKDQVSVLSMK